ncbi:hypothetical protein CVT24_009431 [Panaeolus cyanescens]|uniref:DUF4218 domain-containing protein n=1 Tax=Panaeolus cyanescens TaxID=181874 RepID=A0A409X0S3_9AGAR|nr:hypothetical protein CVT24_009431 [Panaeolus cyanescens]
MVVAMHVILRTARRGCSFIFDMVRQIICVTLINSMGALSLRDRKLVSDMPRDPDTAVQSFKLDRKRTCYAVCPDRSCHRNYPPTYQPGSSIPFYPTYCEEKTSVQGGICGTRLTRPRTYSSDKGKPVTIFVPIKTFVGFCMKDYLASLLSSSKKEDKMDKMSQRQRSDGLMADVIDGEFLKTFKGVDGKVFCGEGRYAFSLSVDFFNPKGNKVGKKSRSVGLISLAPLSLSPTDRYKSENLFVYGIVPGPREPPLTALNHYLEGLIDVLIELWNGVYFSSTSKYPGGRTVHCALIVVVCDLPAARKVAGMSSHNHQFFCSMCKCTLKEHGYSNFDYDRWQHRTDADIRATSKLWRDASTTNAQDSIFSNSGVRWSQLTRLSYFDMAKCIAVDAMHNLFLGLVKDHMRVLGISLPKPPRRPLGPAALDIPVQEPPPDILTTKGGPKSFRTVMNYLQGPLSKTLEDTPSDVSKFLKKHGQLQVLDYIGRALRCDPDPTPTKVTRKDYWIPKIIAWRSRQSESSVGDSGDSGLKEAGYVLTKQERDAIWSDIEHIVTPSWLTSIPATIGEPSAGKLKADQYRVLAGLYLPVSLIRLWSDVLEGDPRSEQRKRILDVTLCLVSAIAIATSRRTSVKHADEYFSLMLKYLTGLKELFPDYKFLPNHHMALHLGDYLKRFGPVHGWWTFPFERLIGILQRIPNNGKIGGELEQTMALSFARAACLRSLFAKNCCPQSIRDIEEVFDKFVHTQSEVHVVSDVLDLVGLDDGQHGSAENATGTSEHEDTWKKRTAVPVPTDLRDALKDHLQFLPDKVQVRKHINIDGFSFSVASRHLGNSSIVYRTSDKEVHTVLGIAKYRPWMGNADPFREHQWLRASLWQQEVEPLVFISTEPDKLVSHFARMDMSFERKDAMVVVSLERMLNMAVAESN